MKLDKLGINLLANLASTLGVTISCICTLSSFESEHPLNHRLTKKNTQPEYFKIHLNTLLISKIFFDFFFSPTFKYWNAFLIWFSFPHHK